MTPDEIVKALRTYAGNAQKNNEFDVMRDFEGAADLIESLQAQLSESQRRERAAVNDLQKSIKFYALGTCICGLCLKHSCNEFCYGKSWEWRGPQEAGEVEADDD